MPTKCSYFHPLRLVYPFKSECLTIAITLTMSLMITILPQKVTTTNTYCDNMSIGYD